MNQHNTHVWRFFRAGGFDQVRIDTGDDICHLPELDRKLWVALACPTRGLEFDHKTLDLIDTDNDGRIRAPELLAATRWACTVLKNPDDLIKETPGLPLAAINDASDEGQRLLASAKQVLINLGKPDATDITVDDSSDTVRIFAQTKFNGDGIITPEAADDPALQSIINDVIACIAVTPAPIDRSGKPGITQDMLDAFFAEAEAYAKWQGELDAAKLPLGDNTSAAVAAVQAVKAKIDDYFARCRLASFDPRAAALINRDPAEYASLALKELSPAAPDIAALPIAAVKADGTLPLNSKGEINPAWWDRLEVFRSQAAEPLLQPHATVEKERLTENEWAALLAKLAPYEEWLAAKAGPRVEKLGIARVREILAANAGQAHAQITALLDKDKSLLLAAGSIAEVNKLVRYHRDLHKLLNNFVSFRDFYQRHHKAVFQVGTLYLDQRACDLCILVEDPARHALMAHLARTYLAYCDCTRKTPDGSVQKMTIAAAFTAGDSDNLMIGRNGIFFDRDGLDWDATITRILENPISIRQAFFAPYKRATRWISDQLAKRAADADAAATARFQSGAGTLIDEVTGKAAPPAASAAPAKSKIDTGIIASLAVAGGFIVGALGAVLQAFFGMGVWMPLGLLGLLAAISGPSMLIAFFKLRQRNLGPILDANGWAVNAKAKINIPFGRSLTSTPKLPPGSHRDLVDPYAERHGLRNWTLAIAVLVLVFCTAWYFGAWEHVPVLKYMLPKSSFVQQREAEAAATQPQTAPAHPATKTAP